MRFSKFFNFWLLSVLLLAAFVNFRWLSFDIFQYGDWRFHFAEVSKRFNELSPWDTFYTLGQPSIFLWKLPFDYIYGLFGKFGIDSNISEKLLVLWPIIFLPTAASFLLVRQVLGSNLAAFTGALVYSFNTYFLSINTQGHEFLTIAAAFGVFALIFLIKAIQENSSRTHIVAVLFGCIAVSYDIRMAMISAVVAMAYVITVVVSSQRKVYVAMGLAKDFGLLGSIFILLNCYWVLPNVFSSSLLSNTILQRQVFGDQFLNILNSIALFHPFWNGSMPEWFVVQSAPVYLLLIPLFAFIGLLFSGKNKDVVFFAGIALIGILLGKQSGEPFTGLYHFLFATIPGFSAFREATKFDFMIALGYAVLVGALVANLEKNKFITHARYASYLVCLTVLGISAWTSKPLITGEIGTMFVKRQVPDEYIKLKNFVLGKNEYSRALWIPTDTPWEVNNDTHPTISLYNLLYGEWADQFVGAKFASDSSAEQRIKAAVTQPNFRRLLSNSSIRYLIVPLRDVANDGDFFQYFGGSRNAYIHELSALVYLDLLNANMTGASVFENTSFRPHCYATTELETISRDVEFQPVDFEVAGRSEYRVRMRNITAPVYLNFTDNYNPQWQLHMGKVSWWEIIAGHSISMSEAKHTKSDAGLNAFLIDPNYIKQNYPGFISTNSDGSINLEVTLYYRPQAYAVLGVVISFATLIGCLFFLMVSYYSTFITYIVNFRPRTHGERK